MDCTQCMPTHEVTGRVGWKRADRGDWWWWAEGRCVAATARPPAQQGEHRCIASNEQCITSPVVAVNELANGAAEGLGSLLPHHLGLTQVAAHGRAAGSHQAAETSKQKTWKGPEVTCLPGGSDQHQDSRTAGSAAHDSVQNSRLQHAAAAAAAAAHLVASLRSCSSISKVTLRPRTRCLPNTDSNTTWGVQMRGDMFKRKDGMFAKAVCVRGSLCCISWQ